MELTSGGAMPQPKTVTIRKLREANYEAIDLVVKQLRAVGADDPTIIAVLKERFTEPATVQSAVLKALGGYREPSTPVAKSLEPTQTTDDVGGAIAKALITGAGQKVGPAYHAEQELTTRIRKGRKPEPVETGAAHDLTHRIRKAAEAAKETN